MSGRRARGAIRGPLLAAWGTRALWSILLSSLGAAALAAPEPVRLSLRGEPLQLRAPALHDGRELYLPLAALPRLGLRYSLERRGEIARVTLPGGRTAEVPLARPTREPMAPFSALAGHLGLEYHREGRNIDLRPAASRSPSRERESPTPPAGRSPPGDGGGVQPAQGIDPPAGGRAPVAAPPAGERVPVAAPPGVVVAVDLPGRLPVSTPADAVVEAVALPPAPGLLLADGRAFLGPAEPPPPEPPPPTSRIVDVLFDAQDEGRVQVRILADGPLQPRAELLSDPTRIAVDLPGAAPPDGVSEWVADHPLLAAVRVAEQQRPGVLRLELALRTLVVHHAAAAADGALVNLRVPRGAGRSVREAVIVLDPGHGGHQPGCSIGIGGGQRVLEKDLVLTVATLAAGILRQKGVQVYMTRTTDVAVPLRARPAMATERNADLFVSIHVDFTPIPNAASGTTVYYHMQDEDSRCLALSLAVRVSRAGGFRNRGAVSDRRLFASGLAVLRHSTVPAALVELGFLSHYADRRRLIRPDVQLALAHGVADGIRGYVEGVLPEQPLTEPPTEEQ